MAEIWEKCVNLHNYVGGTAMPLRVMSVYEI